MFQSGSGADDTLQGVERRSERGVGGVLRSTHHSRRFSHLRGHHDLSRIRRVISFPRHVNDEIAVNCSVYYSQKGNKLITKK